MDADKLRDLVEAELQDLVEAELEKMIALVEAAQRKLDALKTLARDCVKERELTTEKREEFRNRLQAITNEDGEGFTFTCGCDDPLGDLF